VQRPSAQRTDANQLGSGSPLESVDVDAVRGGFSSCHPSLVSLVQTCSALVTDPGWAVE
jgi:hypothetical protein